MLGIQSTDVLEDFRKLRRAVEDLPADLRRDLDAWDPAGTARFIFASPLADSVDAAGRKAYAGRPPAWAALEDKVLIDGFWDAGGVRRAPSRIVATEYDALRSAATELDRGFGTVWAADARDGIHGIVFPDSVAVFRPVEMVVLRPTAGDRLHYAGCATAFDPRPDDRTAMRDLAYRVGAALREAVNYRGPFGIDGILAEEGSLPTELNARAGGAMGRPLAQGAGLPLTPLCLAVTEGEQLDYRPDLLEQAVVESADADRTCAGWSVTPLESRRVACWMSCGTETSTARAGRARNPTALYGPGPGPVGGFVRFRASSGKDQTWALGCSRGRPGISLRGPRARNGFREVRCCQRRAAVTGDGVARQHVRLLRNLFQAPTDALQPWADCLATPECRTASAPDLRARPNTPH